MSLNDFEFTSHAADVIREREISESWISDALNNPDWNIVKEDGNLHYFKNITENNGRVLHVVVNHNISPKRIVTVYFDRKYKRMKQVKNEEKNEINGR
ncbi:MAG: DUF4258 domain-containing protein [bacterium]|jgi:hypothetical protein